MICGDCKYTVVAIALYFQKSLKSVTLSHPHHSAAQQYSFLAVALRHISPQHLVYQGPPYQVITGIHQNYESC